MIQALSVDPKTPDGRGRPKGRQYSECVSIRVTADEHDELIRVANRHGLPLTAFIRQVLFVFLRK